MNEVDSIAALKEQISKSEDLKVWVSKIAEYAKKATGADRCSLFLYDKDKDQLKSVYADGIKGTIILRSNAGIAGYTFHKKEPVVENHPETSTIFLKAVDKKSGYRTRTLLAVPIVGRGDQRLGVMQLLNKAGGFDEHDRQTAIDLAALVARMLEPEAVSVETEPLDEAAKEETLLQNRLDAYLSDKKLFFMDDGNVYYKLLNMIRDYYIGADKCYQLTPDPQEIEVYYYNSFEEFVSVKMIVCIDEKIDGIKVAKNGNISNCIVYPLETES